MTKKELKKLRRTDLLEMLLELRKENDALRAKNAQLEEKLADRTIRINEAGSIAEAALRLNGLFEAAQAACDQYVQSVRMKCGQMEQETTAKCEAMLSSVTDRIKEYEKTDE